MEWALSCDVECLLFPSNNESLRGIRTMSQKLTLTKKDKYMNQLVYQKNYRRRFKPLMRNIVINSITCCVKSQN